jgi:hypothetical protein
MIYMVDHVYTDPATEQDWNDWYAANIGLLLNVPGVYGVQRFRAIGERPTRYLSMYSVESGDVFRDPEYRRVQGGGAQSVQFHRAYGFWTRNLFDGAARAPEILPGQRVAVVDAETPDWKIPPGYAVQWVHSVPGLPTSTPYSAQQLATTPHRAYMVLDAGVDAEPLRSTGIFVYEPITPVRRPPPA